MSLESSFLAM